VCLGGGVAGEAIAVGLQDSGLTLEVVERELVGGECPYWGCVPSKTLLSLRRNADRGTGRHPNVEAWRGAGLAQTERGWLKVDPSRLEAQPGVFGAGDVTGLGGFTHLAYYHGQIVARRLRGMDARADHTAVPRVTYTAPEVASIGLSEAIARARGIDVVVGSADPPETARGYIHPFPAFNRILGQTLEERAAKVAGKGEHDEQYARQH
jgi:pyruvate/2-oxoglutarate dehydrogenase complex dihydrolipoamide dehydrogenase (E3) component